MIKMEANLDEYFKNKNEIKNNNIDEEKEIYQNNK